MIKVSSDADRVILAKVHEHGQGHVFDHWSDLTQEGQKALLAQLRSFDLPALTQLIKKYREGAHRILQDKLRTPAEYVPVPRTDAQRAREAEWRDAGEALLRKDKVALVMAAGGLGSRMGLEVPKGMCPIGPVSGKSLFRLHAERIRALTRRYRSSLPLYVITSEQIRQATAEAFQREDYFGLSRPNVRLVVQGEMPVVDRRGRLILGDPTRVATRPNGHGDALMQLLQDDVFADLERRGVEHVFFYQLDNPLVATADPVFLGEHAAAGCDISAKSVLKTEPEEKIGVFCQVDGLITVVEYSELSDEEKARRLPDGGLAFASGNVAIHLFSMAFLRRSREEKRVLRFHFVDKKTPYVDRSGRKVKPTKPNSVAFERFIFDAFEWSAKTLVCETLRDEEFAPVKDTEGRDCLDTARQAISRLHRSWLEDGGCLCPPPDANGAARKSPVVEISPLFALGPKELRARLKEPLPWTPEIYLE